jgi:hypothetical protein
MPPANPPPSASRKSKITPRQASQLCLSQAETQEIMVRVTAGRMKLHNQLQALDLAATPIRPNTHPLMQTILHIRDHVNLVGTLTADPLEAAKLKMSALRHLQDAVVAAVDEAGKAGDEVRRMTESMLKLEQQAKEHKDKMELARGARGGKPQSTTADILRTILAKGTDAEEIVVLEDDPGAASDHPSPPASDGSGDSPT